MPSQEEQDTVARYVLKRPLVRPNTSYKKAAFYIMLFLLANVLMTYFLYQAFQRLGIFLSKPSGVLLLALFQFAIGGALVAKRAVIGAIHLYQKYAPETIRRRCLCKPTCSEYAILAVEKYGVIRGLLKVRVRLFKTCVGRVYFIDEP